MVENGGKMKIGSRIVTLHLRMPIGEGHLQELWGGAPHHRMQEQEQAVLCGL